MAHQSFKPVWFKFNQKHYTIITHNTLFLQSHKRLTLPVSRRCRLCPCCPGCVRGVPANPTASWQARWQPDCAGDVPTCRRRPGYSDCVPASMTATRLCWRCPDVPAASCAGGVPTILWVHPGHFWIWPCCVPDVFGSISRTFPDSFWLRSGCFQICSDCIPNVSRFVLTASRTSPDALWLCPGRFWMCSACTPDVFGFVLSVSRMLPDSFWLRSGHLRMCSGCVPDVTRCALAVSRTFLDVCWLHPRLFLSIPNHSVSFVNNPGHGHQL